MDFFLQYFANKNINWISKALNYPYNTYNAREWNYIPLYPGPTTITTLYSGATMRWCGGGSVEKGVGKQVKKIFFAHNEMLFELNKNNTNLQNI
jgi:hypothetical protein